MSSKKLAIWAANQAKKSQSSFKKANEEDGAQIVGQPPKPASQKSLKLQKESERRLSRRTVELNSVKPIGWFHPSRAPYRWFILLLTSFFLLSSYMSDESIGATVPILKSELGLTSKQVGLLYSASFVPCIVMTFLGGFLIDKYGTNKISMLYSTFVLFGTVIFALSPNYYGKLAGRIIFGIGLEPLEVCQDAILARWFSDDGVKAGSPTLAFSYGFTFAVSQAGELLGANSLPTLAQYGLFYAYIFCAGACVLGWICNLVLVYFDWKAQAVIELNDDDEEDEAFSFKALKQFPIQYWMLGFITMLSYSSMLIFFTFSTDIMNKKYGYSAKEAGHLMSFVYGLSILFSPIVGWFINKYGMICWLMSLGGLLYSGSAFFMAFTNFSFTPIVSLVAAGLAYSLVPNAIWPAVSLATDDENAGTAFGIVTGMNSIMLLGCPYLIGFLHDTYGNYQYALMTFGGLGGLGFLLSFSLYFVDRAKGSLIHIHEPKEEANEKQPLLTNSGSGSLKK